LAPAECQFEDRVRALLAHTAEAIPDDTDLTERVRQAHARAIRGMGRGIGRAAGPRHVLATVAAVVVVALLAGVLTFVRPGGTGWPAGGPTATATLQQVVVMPPDCGQLAPDSLPPPYGTVDHSIAVGRSASHHGITITIDRAYADATQTVITYHMQTNLNPPLPVSAVLMDAQGHRYVELKGSWGIQSGGQYVFSPLPPEESGTPQALTFFTQQMQSITGREAVVDGPWEIPFTLTPAAGIAVALSNAPVTHNGLTIQPLRLDVAPAGGALDGQPGGARLVVRLSGLAPSMLPSDIPSFDSVFVDGDGVPTAACGGGLLVLVRPNGQQILPGFVQPLEQTIGPSGTADVEVLFYAPMLAGTSLTLYVDRVGAQLAGKDTFQWISGPWAFRLSTGA
jgi:hypothetical protein